ncbi:hypothetical protein FQA39_LY18637 [Lamprigera yunnana]|nr:hypothetical protein FQA39_LY18637 [Lamprigera yunnana]
MERRRPEPDREGLERSGITANDWTTPDAEPRPGRPPIDSQHLQEVAALARDHSVAVGPYVRRLPTASSHIGPVDNWLRAGAPAVSAFRYRGRRARTVLASHLDDVAEAVGHQYAVQRADDSISGMVTRCPVHHGSTSLAERSLAAKVSRSTGLDRERRPAMVVGLSDGHDAFRARMHRSVKVPPISTPTRSGPLVVVRIVRIFLCEFVLWVLVPGSAARCHDRRSDGAAQPGEECGFDAGCQGRAPSYLNLAGWAAERTGEVPAPRSPAEYSNPATSSTDAGLRGTRGLEKHSARSLSAAWSRARLLEHHLGRGVFVRALSGSTSSTSTAPAGSSNAELAPCRSEPAGHRGRSGTAVAACPQDAAPVLGDGLLERILRGPGPCASALRFGSLRAWRESRATSRAALPKERNAAARTLRLGLREHWLSTKQHTGSEEKHEMQRIFDEAHVEARSARAARARDEHRGTPIYGRPRNLQSRTGPIGSRRPVSILAMPAADAMAKVGDGNQARSPTTGSSSPGPEHRVCRERFASGRTRRPACERRQRCSVSTTGSSSRRSRCRSPPQDRLENQRRRPFDNAAGGRRGWPSSKCHWTACDLSSASHRSRSP